MALPYAAHIGGCLHAPGNGRQPYTDAHPGRSVTGGERERGVAAGVMADGEGARLRGDGKAGEPGEQLLQDDAGL